MSTGRRCRNAPSAAARTVGACDGRSSADSRSAHSAAAGVSNTLPVRVRTAGTPARPSAVITRSAVACDGTSTAMWPGCTATAVSRIVRVWCSSRSTTVRTRSAMMACCASGDDRPLLDWMPASSGTRRSTSGAPGVSPRAGADSAGLTGVTAMRGSPSSMCASNVLVAATRSASLRWLVLWCTVGCPSVADR